MELPVALALAMFAGCVDGPGPDHGPLPQLVSIDDGVELQAEGVISISSSELRAATISPVIVSVLVIDNAGIGDLRIEAMDIESMPAESLRLTSHGQSIVLPTIVAADGTSVKNGEVGSLTIELTLDLQGQELAELVDGVLTVHSNSVSPDGDRQRAIKYRVHGGR